MLLRVYQALWWFAAPIAVLRLLLRACRERGYARHIGERFGYSAGRPKDGAPLIWVHAVSVGETRAAQPLIEALRTVRPDAHMLITHMTPGGRATGQQLFGARILRCYLPYDMPCAVRRFLKRYRPALGIVMETEVWPTLIDACRRARIPLVLANARMSARSYQRAVKFGAKSSALARASFCGFTRVLAQSPADAERLRALGAREVAVFGNLKFDITAPAALIARGRAWRRAFGAQPVWIAASTRAGEEALVLEAFRRSGLADRALLILVPRHPQRFDAVAAQLARAGWRFARRSAAALPNDNDADPLQAAPSTAGMRGVQVWLGDSMGELSAYYAAADLAFIGGSLVPAGGQNLIEACALGVPVLLGPHTFNFEQASADALAAGAARRVADPAALGEALHRLLTDRPRRLEMAAAAAAFAARHRGATRRTVEAVIALID